MFPKLWSFSKDKRLHLLSKKVMLNFALTLLLECLEGMLLVGCQNLACIYLILCQRKCREEVKCNKNNHTLGEITECWLAEMGGIFFFLVIKRALSSLVNSCLSRVSEVIRKSSSWFWLWFKFFLFTYGMHFKRYFWWQQRLIELNFKPMKMCSADRFLSWHWPAFPQKVGPLCEKQCPLVQLISLYF